MGAAYRQARHLALVQNSAQHSRRRHAISAKALGKCAQLAPLKAGIIPADTAGAAAGFLVTFLFFDGAIRRLLRDAVRNASVG